MIGFLNVIKPSGITSAQVVAKVKKLLNLDKTTKVGHTGTLDPLASGVLPIAVGKATRLFDFLLSKTKEYEAEFTFGYETDTLDSAGKTIATSTKIPALAEIETKLNMFVGNIEQFPPQFSAKSVNGARAYTLARRGEVVDLKPSVVNVEKFEVIQQVNATTFKFKIVCGSGTYIRSLCRDLAHALGSYATMTSLIRVRVGAFMIDSGVPLEKVQKEKILPCEFVLTKLDSIKIDEPTFVKLRNGQRVNYEWNSTELLKVYHDDLLVGLGMVESSNLKIKIWLM